MLTSGSTERSLRKTDESGSEKIAVPNDDTTHPEDANRDLVIPVSNTECHGRSGLSHTADDRDAVGGAAS